MLSQSSVAINCPRLGHTGRLNMSPAHSTANPANQGATNAIPFAKCSMRHIQWCIENFKHLLRSKFGLSLFLTLWKTTFVDCVLHVHSSGPNKQVSRVYTNWIVALVANIQSMRNWPMFQFPGNAMAEPSPKPTISIGVFVAGPQPAIVRLGHVRPKLILLRFGEFNRGGHLSLDPTPTT